MFSDRVCLELCKKVKEGAPVPLDIVWPLLADREVHVYEMQCKIVIVRPKRGNITLKERFATPVMFALWEGKRYPSRRGRRSSTEIHWHDLADPDSLSDPPKERTTWVGNYERPRISKRGNSA